MLVRRGLLSLILALAWAGVGTVCARAGTPDTDVRVAITCQVKPIDHYTVTTTTPQTAWIGWTETVTACDAGGNLLAYGGVTVTLTSSGNAVFYTDGNYATTTTTATLTNGVATIYVKDAVVETITLTATDGNGKTGTSGNIVILPNSTLYTITATAGAKGRISPKGTVTLFAGTNQTFAIKPKSGYRVKSVVVDGVSVGKVTTYTFYNVTANHTITAKFTIAKRGRTRVGGCSLSTGPPDVNELLGWALPYLAFGTVYLWAKRRSRRRRRLRRCS